MTARILGESVIDRFRSGCSLGGRMAAAANGGATVLRTKKEKGSMTGPAIDDHTLDTSAMRRSLVSFAFFAPIIRAAKANSR